MEAGRSGERAPATITPHFEVRPFIKITNLIHTLPNICQMKTNHNEAGNSITQTNYGLLRKLLVSSSPSLI